MSIDWIDKEKQCWDDGINRALTQDQHVVVNARYPGATLEYCCQCGEATGRAGRGDDSLFTEDLGPFCLVCWEDICGLCGKPGADKYAHPIHWPGEQVPDGPLVHAACENEECRRAHSLLSDKQQADFLRWI